MKRHFFNAICITIGSLALYCGQSTMSSMMSDGGVSDANAQACGSCCTQAPVFTKIWEGDITETTASPDIAVAPYRQVVLSVTANTCTSGPPALVPWFRPDANTAYGSTGQQALGFNGTIVNPGGLIRVDGSSMQIQKFATNACGFGSRSTSSSPAFNSASSTCVKMDESDRGRNRPQRRTDSSTDASSGEQLAHAGPPPSGLPDCNKAVRLCNTRATAKTQTRNGTMAARWIRPM